MACIKKQNTGSCNHYTCPYQNHSGYECVDVAHSKENNKTYCEVGEDCFDGCEHSGPSGTDEALLARKAFQEAFPIPIGVCKYCNEPIWPDNKNIRKYGDGTYGCSKCEREIDKADKTPKD